MASSLANSKIIDFAVARRRLRQRRREIRKSCYKRLFIHIVDCPWSDLVGATQSWVAVNISPNGLRLRGHHEIPEGSQVDLWLDNSVTTGKLYLTGVVRWSHCTANDFELGVELDENEMTDIRTWQRYAL